jgi:mono/diheme cytochrome c family protein
MVGGGGGSGTIDPIGLLTGWQPGAMPIQLLLVIGVTFALFLTVNYLLKKNGKGIPMLAQGALVWLAALIILKYVMSPPIPSSLLYIYMGLITLVLGLFISANEASWTEAKRPVVNTLVGASPAYRGVRALLFVALPLGFGWGTYNSIAPPKVYPEPPELRTVHPAPPQAIKVQDKQFTLQTAQNPFRVDAEGEYLEVGKEKEFFASNPFAPDASGYIKYVREGGEVFFKNCHFCHGDNLDGRGMFAFAFRPTPANLADPGTIAQLQETFVFWRISKGGMNAPPEINPWDSAMPPWEEHLKIDEIWKVALFEYWHTEFFPRTWE